MNDRKHPLKHQYKRLYDDLVEILYRHDPIGIGLSNDGPPGEYEPEAETILPRLRGVKTATQLASILREEFVHWFDEDIAGPIETYVPIAEEILAAMRRGDGSQL